MLPWAQQLVFVVDITVQVSQTKYVSLNTGLLVFWSFCSWQPIHFLYHDHIVECKFLNSTKENFANIEIVSLYSCFSID